jgi:RNA polymerase sigma-70 factor (ECF subfamily)
VLGDSAQADEVQQLVLIQAYRDLPCFEGRSPLRNWLFAIAHNRAVDAKKRRRASETRFQEANIAAIPDPSPMPDVLLENARLYQIAIECLSRTEEPARTALLMRYQQGFTFEEMAEIVGVKPGTLQARAARALRTLRTCIEARLGPDPESHQESKGDSP